MATIGEDRMIVSAEERADGSWLFTICYTAQFDEADLGRRFDDAVQIFEMHRSGPRPADSGSPVSFRATGTRVLRKKRIVVRRNAALSAGPDAVHASIRLYHHVGDDVLRDDEQTTPPVPTGTTRAPRTSKSVRSRRSLVKVSGYGSQRFA